jgi:hypothetical protein
MYISGQEIVKLIAEKYAVPEKKALDMFYTSATAASLADDETGLYGQVTSPAAMAQGAPAG